MMNKEELKSGILNALHGIDPKTATPQQLHQALGETIMEAIAPDWNKSMDAHERSRRACYFSMEFLVGRAVYNNLLVLDVMKEAEAAFAELGVSLADLEVIEDAALGNGGLGRLAACFLDSAATLDLPLDGYGIRYKYGLFKQYFEDGFRRKCRTTGCATAMPGRCAGTRMLFWWNSRDRPFVPCRMICR